MWEVCLAGGAGGLRAPPPTSSPASVQVQPGPSPFHPVLALGCSILISQRGPTQSRESPKVTQQFGDQAGTPKARATRATPAGSLETYDLPALRKGPRQVLSLPPGLDRVEIGLCPGAFLAI